MWALKPEIRASGLLPSIESARVVLAAEKMRTALVQAKIQYIQSFGLLGGFTSPASSSSIAQEVAPSAESKTIDLSGGPS